jgi:hypothetical protein
MSPATRACFAHCVECGLPSADEERSTVTTFEKFATAILCLVWVDLVLAQELFELRSSAFDDNGKLQTKNAGKNPDVPSCIGDNVSPPLSCSGVPAGTKSLVALMDDQLLHRSLRRGPPHAA